MIAGAVVHTEGINIESLSAILVGVAAIVGVLQTFVYKRQTRLEKAASQMESRTAKAIEDQTAILLAKLETKENVSELRVKVAEMSGILSSLTNGDYRGRHGGDSN